MRLYHLFLALMSVFVLACPPTNNDDDDDSGSEDSALCTGPGCQNAAECPAEEPTDGDACDFPGNCHYCEGESTAASGYTCDGTSFTYVDVFECSE